VAQKWLVCLCHEGDSPQRHIIFCATEYNLCCAPHKLYTDDPRDLSRAPTLAAFLDRYKLLIANCAGALAPRGKLAVLMGDYQDRETGFVPLVHHTKALAFECGLHQVCTDIIRFSHGASSSKKVYRSSFIPGLHDVCMIFEKPRSATANSPFTSAGN